MNNCNEFSVDFKPTKYSGYSSYSYLEDGRDLESFVLAPELGRVPLYDLGLSEDQADRTKRIIDANIMVSLHDHPQVFPDDISKVREYIRTGRERTGYLGLSHRV